MCRLVNAAYYCGALATGHPYKGLTTTAGEKPHVGSDEYFESGHATPKAATGYKTIADSLAQDTGYTKLRKPLNPDYYQAMDSYNWRQSSGNNGQLKEHPTHSAGLTEAVYSNGIVGANATSRF
eukprot:1958452-Prymnesium_polylepis.1